jgi:hypothetical protein
MDNTLMRLHESPGLMEDYLKWKANPITEFVSMALRDVALENAKIAIPPIPVQGVLTEICALRDRRTAGFVECIDSMMNLDAMGKKMDEMPEENFKTSEEG